MPYLAGQRLPGERASKLGHLEVLKSEHVNRLIKSFEDAMPPVFSTLATWSPVSFDGEPLKIIFGIDGSYQPLQAETPPYKKIAFVKTALLRIDQFAISKVNKDSPHPLALKDILTDSALYHATVFPLKHVSIPNMSTYHTIRQIIYESVKDASLSGWPMETLKWIAYEKWNPQSRKPLPKFECPHCEKDEATLDYDQETGQCPNCGKDLFVTDMLGFHQEMGPDAAPDSIASNYMAVHETLLLFTGIRYFWENRRDMLSQCLFVKDGPLSIRAQYSKLVNPIRRFLAYARGQDHPVHIIGQEKSGRFYEHLEIIGKDAPVGRIFIPTNQYVKEEIQNRPNTGAPYGKDTNYGVKVFVKMNSYHQMVLNIPTGEFIEDPNYSDLIGADRIFATLPSILSNRYEGALLPVELANGIASLSTYPSAQILKIFAEAKGYL